MQQGLLSLTEDGLCRQKCKIMPAQTSWIGKAGSPGSSKPTAMLRVWLLAGVLSTLEA